MPSTPESPLLAVVADRAREKNVFGDICAEGPRLRCRARDADAEYRVDLDPDGRVWISLVTPDRWLSESIESELVNTGDSIVELIEDELIDLGWEGTAMPVEHYRSEDLLFTFRSSLCFDDESPEVRADAVATCLLAYQACFVQLGDMGGEDGD